MSEEILTAQEVAVKLHLSPKTGGETVIGWARSGKISYLRPGRAYLFRMVDVLAYGYKAGSGGQINKRYLGHR